MSSFNTQTLNDYSSTVGVRQYNAGFENLNFSGLTGGGLLGAGAVRGRRGEDGRGSTLTVDARTLAVRSVGQPGHPDR